MLRIIWIVLRGFVSMLRRQRAPDPLADEISLFTGMITSAVTGTVASGNSGQARKSRSAVG